MKYSIPGLRRNTTLRLFYYWWDCLRQIPAIVKQAKAEDKERVNTLLHIQAHDYAVHKSWK